MPDLRFVIGAVLAIALLGVTAFGLGAAVHIVQQAKLGPLEASRMLAYTPLERSEPAQHADSPFARIPSVPAAMLLPPAENAQVAQAAVPAPAADAAPAQPAPTPAPGDADTVDERAVVDPPLPLETDPQSPPPTAAEATPAIESAPTAEPMRSSAAPAMEPVSASAPLAPAAPMQASEAPPPPPATEAPVEAAIAVDAEPVGSIPAMATRADEGVGSEPPSVVAPQAKKTRKATPKAKRAVRKATAKARPKVRAIQPTASTGYPVTADGMVSAPAPRARSSSNSSNQNLWSDF